VPARSIASGVRDEYSTTMRVSDVPKICTGPGIRENLSGEAETPRDVNSEEFGAGRLRIVEELAIGLRPDALRQLRPNAVRELYDSGLPGDE
jgi:hypothetical protein